MPAGSSGPLLAAPKPTKVVRFYSGANTAHPRLRANGFPPAPTSRINKSSPGRDDSLQPFAAFVVVQPHVLNAHCIEFIQHHSAHLYTNPNVTAGRRDREGHLGLSPGHLIRRVVVHPGNVIVALNWDDPKKTQKAEFVNLLLLLPCFLFVCASRRPRRQGRAYAPRRPIWAVCRGSGTTQPGLRRWLRPHTLRCLRRPSRSLPFHRARQRRHRRIPRCGRTR